MKFNTKVALKIKWQELSRRSGAELLTMALSVLHSDLQNKIIASYNLDINVTQLIQKLQQGLVVPNFAFQDGLFRRKNRIVVGPDDELNGYILQWMHIYLQGGHSGRDAALQRVKHIFYWKGLTTFVTNFVRHCVVCQANKSENEASY